MLVAVLGHTGMLGRRVMERFPDALTFSERYPALLEPLREARPDWVVNCIGTTVPSEMWAINAELPHVLAAEFRLIQPSTDHVTDDTDYAVSKRIGECGTVIRCAIVDPDGGMLARARAADTVGEVYREWNGLTARAWAEVASLVIEGGLPDRVLVPGSPTISHFDLLQTARRLFGWQTHTIPDTRRHWRAEHPTVRWEPISEQLADYL